jgi:hypothetical protein
MTASAISSIITQLVTDIETTSIDKCNIGAAMNQTKFPRAEFYLGGGNISEDMTQVCDTEFDFIVRVHGQSFEQVNVALKELMVLWYGQSLRNVLGLLGVINIMPVSQDPPVVFAPSSSTASTTQVPIIGDIQFRMTVRYTI